MQTPQNFNDISCIDETRVSRNYANDTTQDEQMFTNYQNEQQPDNFYEQRKIVQDISTSYLDDYDDNNEHYYGNYKR